MSFHRSPCQGAAAASLEPPYGARDAHGMAGLIEALPAHVAQSLERVKRAPWRLPLRDPDLLAVGGMGGSAIAAELTAALEADRVPRPIVIVRGYRWPACVTPRSLVLLSSNSGNTEEVLALERAARERDLPRVAMASGGTLARLAEAHGVFVHAVPGGMPPRAALFHGWVPLTFLLHALGWTGDPGTSWAEAAATLEAGNDRFAPRVPEERNPAKQLARALHGRGVIVYSGSGASAAAAVRWRQQLNENAKMPGHSAAVPELQHNEICSWQHGGAAQSRLSVVMLRDGDDSPQERARLDLTSEIVTRAGGRVHEISAEGENRLARIARLVQIGDWLSFYLALLEGVDPTDISVLVEIKRRLADSRTAGS